MIGISQEEMRSFIQLVYCLTGMTIENGKEYLIENRLEPMINELKCNSYTDLLGKIKNDSTGILERSLVDLITIGETSFFRDQAPFEMLQFKVIPDLIDNRNKKGHKKPIKIRIWSAACSSGQEVYTVAIILKELLEPNGYLINGSTESLFGICPQYVPYHYLRSVYYQIQ